MKTTKTLAWLLGASIVLAGCGDKGSETTTTGSTPSTTTVTLQAIYLLMNVLSDVSNRKYITGRQGSSVLGQAPVT